MSVCRKDTTLINSQKCTKVYTNHNELIDKNMVYGPDKSSIHRKQKIEIYYKTVGIINTLTDESNCRKRKKRSLA